MSALAVLPTPASVEAAWERFRALAAAVATDPALLANRSHMEQMARAEKAWKQAFLAMDSAA